MTHPNVRRIHGSSNPDDRSYTGLGHVDRDGTYHFPDGTQLPATGGIIRPNDPLHSGGGTTHVVQEDATIGNLPTPDGADLVWSGLQMLHCVDTHRQDAYDLAEFGSVGGDPVPVQFDASGVNYLRLISGPVGADPQGPDVRAYEVGSPEYNAAVAQSRRDHPERHQGTSPYTDPGSYYSTTPATKEN